MKSKAHVKGHPLHPILIVFPIAFFNGTLIFDALGWLFNNGSLITTAMHLEIAGLISAPVAATPGFIDLVYTVPPRSTGKKRGVRHALIMLTMLVFFAVALALRLQETYSFAWVFLLEAAGVVLLTVAGWMGGTLVTRNQISIDPRYAHAGKWKEENITTHNGLATLGNTSELKVNQMKLVHLNGHRMVVARTESGYVAFDDHCTHRGGSLAGGAMICGTVQCPWHGSQFDVVTGDVKAGPAEEKIITYNLIEKDGTLYMNAAEIANKN